MIQTKTPIIFFICIIGGMFFFSAFTDHIQINNRTKVQATGLSVFNNTAVYNSAGFLSQDPTLNVLINNPIIRNNHSIFVNAGGSIKAAYDLALPGDTILIEEGTYKERLILKKDSLTIRSYTRRTATINGGFEIWSNHIKIERLKFTNDVVKVWPDRYTIFLRNGSNGTQITDNYFFNIPGDAAISADENNTVTDVIIKDNYIYNCTMGIDIHGKNWLVENNEVEKLHNYGYGDSDYSLRDIKIKNITYT